MMLIGVVAETEPHETRVAASAETVKKFLALGAEAEAGLAAALVRLGARRLAAGGDDVARLVPEYVTLPRGVSVAKGEVRWSHDHR